MHTDDSDATGEQHDAPASRHFEWHENETPSTVMVEAVEQATDRDVVDLPTLNQYVDPDALDALLTAARERNDSTVSVSFTYETVEVFAESDGRILVTEAQP